MANPAEATDLAAYGWTGDATVAQGWLDAAWIIVNARVPDIDTRITEGTVEVATVIYVLCQMALRVLRNLDGMRRQSVAVDDANLSWTLDARVASGVIGLETSEFALLTGQASGVAFSVMPS